VGHRLGAIYTSASSSCMRVMNHNWSAIKQRLHPQSVVEISCHSVLSGDRIQQCGTSSGCYIHFCFFFLYHHHQSELVGDVAVPVSARQAVLF